MSLSYYHVTKEDEVPMNRDKKVSFKYILVPTVFAKKVIDVIIRQLHKYIFKDVTTVIAHARLFTTSGRSATDPRDPLKKEYCANTEV